MPGTGEGDAQDSPVVGAINKPTLLSAGATLLVALAALAILADGDARVAVLAEAGMLSLVVVASALDDRDRPVLARVCQATGVAGALVVIAVATVTVTGVAVIVEVLPGMVGLLLVTLAVFPRSGRGSRTLAKAGATALLLSVFTSGLLRAATLEGLVLAAAGSVLVWDLGEQAICLGEHLGRRAATRRLEGVHAAGGTLVAGVGVFTVLTIDGLASPGLPLHSFLLLVVAVMVFALSLYD